MVEEVMDNLSEDIERCLKFNESAARLKQFELDEGDVDIASQLGAFADGGMPIAAVWLGAAYELGSHGAPRDRMLAKRYFQVAADGGSPTGMLHLGRIYYEDCQYGLALPWWLRAAQLGEFRANVNLGACFELGLGVPADAGRAFSFYRAAAVEGVASGCYFLSKCYWNGVGTEVDKTMMRKSLDAACSMDEPRALYWRAVLQLSGEIQSSSDGARQDMRRAADLSHTLAQEFYGEHLATRASSDTGEHQKAADFLNEAMREGSTRSKYTLAYIYAFGLGVDSNRQKALELCVSAADEGIEDAIATVLAVNATQSGLEPLLDRKNWFESRQKQEN